jgi:rod shape-determining protein MreD
VSSVRLAVGLVLSLLGTLGFGAIGLRVAPDFLMLPVGDAALRGRAPLAMLAGLLSGILEDLVSVPGRLLGLHAFTKILLGYLLASVAARMVVVKPAAVGALLGAAVLVESIALVLLLWILRGEVLLPSPLLVLARAAGTGIVAAALQAATRHPWRERHEARRRTRLG